MIGTQLPYIRASDIEVRNTSEDDRAISLIAWIPNLLEGYLERKNLYGDEFEFLRDSAFEDFRRKVTSVNEEIMNSSDSATRALAEKTLSAMLRGEELSEEITVKSITEEAKELINRLSPDFAIETEDICSFSSFGVLITERELSKGSMPPATFTTKKRYTDYLHFLTRKFSVATYSKDYDTINKLVQKVLTIPSGYEFLMESCRLNISNRDELVPIEIDSKDARYESSSNTVFISKERPASSDWLCYMDNFEKMRAYKVPKWVEYIHEAAHATDPIIIPFAKYHKEALFLDEQADEQAKKELDGRLLSNLSPKEKALWTNRTEMFAIKEQNKFAEAAFYKERIFHQAPELFEGEFHIGQTFQVNRRAPYSIEEIETSTTSATALK